MASARIAGAVISMNCAALTLAKRAKSVASVRVVGAVVLMECAALTLAKRASNLSWAQELFRREYEK